MRGVDELNWRMGMSYQRPLLSLLLGRILEPRKFIQVIAGPRQVGKTTIAIALR